MTEDFITQGIQAAQDGDTQRAVVLLSQAVRQTPGSAQAWYWLGKMIDDPAKKKFCFDRAVQLDPKVGTQPAVDVDLHPPFAAQIPPAAPLKVVSILPSKKSEIRWPVWVALGGLGMLVCTTGTFLLIILFSNGVFGWSNRPAVPLITQLPSSTYLVWPSGTPTLPPSETPSRTPTPIPSGTPTRNATQIYDRLAPQVTAARQALDEKRASDCILAYDQLLMDLPNWPSGYYNRGVCERLAAYWEYDRKSFDKTLRKAIADVDKAIEIGPAKGNYFVERGYQYMDLTDVIDYWVDAQPYLKAAIVNMQAGIAMGTTLSDAEFNLVKTLVNANYCDEALLEAKRVGTLLPAMTVSDSQYLMMAYAYLCLENYPSALAMVNESLNITDSCEGRIAETTILLGLGNFDKALDQISGCIERSPLGGGYRYYLRALIYYDQGKLDLARTNLETGAVNTYYHGGLYLYLRGRFALASNQREEGIQWLQFAYASVQPIEGSWLRDRIRVDLEKLNAPRINPTVSVKLQITPIPNILFTPSPITTKITGSVSMLTPTLSPAVNGTPIPTTYPTPVTGLDAIAVDFNGGTGPLTLSNNAFPLFYFRPTPDIPVRRVVSLKLYMAPSQSGKPPLQLSLWVKEGGWRTIQPVWGENPIEYPSFYILPRGEMYFAIRNFSASDTIKIDNITLLATVELTDGSLVTYGKKP